MKAPCPLVEPLATFRCLLRNHLAHSGPFTYLFPCIFPATRPNVFRLVFTALLARRRARNFSGNTLAKYGLAPIPLHECMDCCSGRCRYLMRGRRLKAPKTRPLERHGMRGEYTHDYHSRCDFALGGARRATDMALQLGLGILPKRRPRTCRSDPRDTPASWAHIANFDAERERT
jgi:hypothetical protein